jgi:outer membrane protein
MIDMKNVHYVIDGVLAVAVVILFILYFTGNKNATNLSRTAISSTEEFSSTLPVAYIDADLLLEKYFFSIDLHEQITKKEENARAYLSQEDKKLQSATESFQFRYENNAFTSQDRAQAEYQRLQRQQQELQATAEKMQMALLEEAQQLNIQMRDTIISHLKEYNLMKNFEIIYSNGSSNTVNPIVFAKDVYNVTDEVIEYLNKKWISK